MAGRSLLKFAKYLLATGSSSALALTGTAILARNLGPPSFVLVNLQLVTANMLAQLGAGADSAAARFLASKKVLAPTAVTWARSWRVLLAFFSLPISTIVLTSAASAEPINLQVLLIVICTFSSIALASMFLSIVEPQARGRSMQYGWRQFTYYGPFFLVCMSSFAIQDLASICLLFLLAAALTVLSSILIGSIHVARSEHDRWFDLGNTDYKKLVLAMASTGILYTVGERLDVILVTIGFSVEAAADYAVAARVAGTLAVVVGAVQAMNISHYGSATRVRELLALSGKQWPTHLFVLFIAIALALIAPPLTPLAFGSEYQLSSFPLVLLCLPYALYALTSPIILAIAALGYRRPLVLVAGAGFCLKLGIALLAITIQEPRLLYASNLTGAAGSACCVFAIAFRISREEPGQ